MNRTIIVTDLTRFKNQDKVCTAGVDTITGECIRPMPYLKRKDCQRLNILPGAKLQGEFSPIPNLIGPHQEDHKYENLKFAGPCSSSNFKKALKQNIFNSVGEGFNILPRGEKHFPTDTLLQRSIITISIFPTDIEIVEDGFNTGKIKVHFCDHSAQEFRYIPITDLGYYDYALQHHSRSELHTLNAIINSQEGVYLRIGLSRAWSVSDGRNGYWMQVNGIYTFPEYNEDIRCYAPEAES